jgi:hypothetical protein
MNHCAKINYSEFLLFADLKIYQDMTSVQDRKFLQADINLIQKWSSKNCMALNIQKTKISSFICKANSIHFNYYVSDSGLHTGCRKDLSIVTKKLHFHYHVDCVYSEALKILGLVR